MIRRDYYVQDEYNDMWNVEALPTFAQAWYFKGLVMGGLNSPRTLRVTSTVRGVIEPPKPKIEKVYAQTADF